jgi:glyoxylase-like metal-dependent hydrolase (beta-lactamase superfamily II)
MTESYPAEFMAQAQDTCWSIFTAPEAVPEKAAKLLADWPQRFASHHLAGCLTMGLGDYEGGRTEMELARGWADDDEEDFVFGDEQFDGKETVKTVLEPMGENIWAGEAVYDIMPGGPMKFHQVVRVIRLQSGGLVVVNPVALTDELQGQINALGPVEFLVTQTAFHYMFIAPWQAAWPQAKLIGPQAHREKAEVQGLAYAGYLDDAAPFAGGEIEQVHFDGHAFDETALYHAPSRSLLLTDMVLSGKEPRTRFIDFYCWLWGQHRACGCLAYHRLLTQDAGALRASLEAVAAWDFEQILGGHGPAERGDVKAKLAAAWEAIFQSL